LGRRLCLGCSRGAIEFARIQFFVNENPQLVGLGPGIPDGPRSYTAKGPAQGLAIHLGFEDKRLGA
jgi:hypothetical protein